jgi:hypothetical protein
VAAIQNFEPLWKRRKGCDVVVGAIQNEKARWERWEVIQEILRNIEDFES